MAATAAVYMRSVGVLTTDSREKGQKHVNKTAAEAAEAACREKSSEQQLFLPFSALLYAHVNAHTSVYKNAGPFTPSACPRRLRDDVKVL